MLRGSHDGFVESIMKNAAPLRRRIRDPQLTLEGLKVGGRSHADVALCYLADKADSLEELRGKLHMRISSISMSQGEHCRGHRPRPNGGIPSPRPGIPSAPDVATASIMEGDVVLIYRQHPVGDAVSMHPVPVCRGNQRLLLPAPGRVVFADRADDRAAFDAVCDAPVVPAGKGPGEAPRESAFSADRDEYYVPLDLQRCCWWS